MGLDISKHITEHSILKTAGKKYVDDSIFWSRAGTVLSPKTAGDDIKVNGVTILDAAPILVFQDSNGAGAASTGFIEWKDQGGGRAGYFGNASSGDDDLSWSNEQGGHIKIITTGAGELQVSAPLNMNTNKIAGVVDPTANQEAATKKYVDDEDAAADAHITADGSSHANVVTNTSGVSTNVTAIGLNTTHRGSAGGTDHSDVNTNNAKVSNVTTNITVVEAPTNVDIQSSDGTNDTIAAADITNAGVMTTTMYDNHILNNAKNTDVNHNVTTNLSEGTATNTTLNVNSSDGTNATLASASTTRAGVLTKAKWDEVVVNSLHSADNSQAHTDYLINTGNDSTTGILTAPNFISNVAIGTIPYATTSTTKCTNLNADLLEGQHAVVAAGNNTIVQRHASGYILANFFNTTPNTVTTGVTQVCVETGNDGFIRHGTEAAIRTFMGITATGTEINTVADGVAAKNAHTHTHLSTTGRTADDHHNQSHNIASHSDTTATGTELDTLTDGGETALHSHAGGGGDVTAASNLTDNAIVRGDGGAKGVQTSTVIIDDDGKVGIGTTPLTTLHIKMATDQHLLFSQGGGADVVIGALNDSFATIPMDFNASEFWFEGGDVGIGTITPAGKLDVNGDIFAAGSIVTESTAPIANAVRVTGEYMLTEDNELDYSASFTDGMGGATITFSELPANTVGIWVNLQLADTGVTVRFEWRRTVGASENFQIRYQFADGGTNRVFTTAFMPTGGNSLYVLGLDADTTSNFKIIGYKVGE